MHRVLHLPRTIQNMKLSQNVRPHPLLMVIKSHRATSLPGGASDCRREFSSSVIPPEPPFDPPASRGKLSGEILAVGMVEDESGNAGFGDHHHFFGERNADGFVRLQKIKQ